MALNAPKAQPYLASTRNTEVRQLVLGWIGLLDSLPQAPGKEGPACYRALWLLAFVAQTSQVDMISFLPHFLEGLFSILASENRNFRMEVSSWSLAGIADSLSVARPRHVWRASGATSNALLLTAQSGHSRP